MAVEAGLFHPQMMTTNAIDNQANGNTTFGYGIDNPLSAMYCSGFTDSIAPLKAESGLTFGLPVTRKRARTLFPVIHGNQNPVTFLGEDISLQIQQQQLEIDQFVAHYNEKVRVDVEERRKQNSRRIMAAVEERISKRLKTKEEEIMKMTKLNWALEEKVKSLCVENQIWRELAQTNEATANALRNNLRQVLEQVVHDRSMACVEEDAQSCCESNHEERPADNINNDCNSNSNNNNRWCKKCGQEESCVLLLPCRHLCLCTTCASSVTACPLCKSAKNISVHVNMS